jgi:hypothetical protein
MPRSANFFVKLLATQNIFCKKLLNALLELRTSQRLTPELYF